MYRRGRMSVFVCVHALGGQRSVLGVITQKALHLACEVSSSQDCSSPSGPGLMASQTQTASCLYFSSGFARTHDKFYFMWVLEIQLGLSYVHGKPFTQWAIVPAPFMILSFEEPKLPATLILILNEGLFRSTHSHNKHKHLVEV